MGRLFWKILLGFWCAILLTSVGVGVVVSLYKDSRTSSSDDLARGYTTALMTSAAASALASGGTTAFNATLENWPRFARERLMAVDDQGRDALGRTVPSATLEQARRLAKLGAAAPGATRPAGPEVRTVRAVDGQRYLLFMSARESGFSHRPPFWRAALLRQLLLCGIAGLAFSTVLAWYLARPVRQLRHAFDRVGRGDLQVRVGQAMGRRHDEITDLGHAFDRMAERLEQLVKSQRQLLHDVSHELRSPLARLQTAVGLMRQQPDKARAMLERIEAESERLDSMVGELLTLSRLEAGEATPPDEYFDLLGLADAAIADARFEAERAGVAIEFTADGDAVARGRAELMRRALENVIRNAVRYSRPGQTVEVQADRSAAGDWLAIRVLDRGPGVPEAGLERIFEPFVRLPDSARGTGFGLGLAIARRALSAHGGTIAAHNREGGGLIIEMRMPLVSPRTAAMDYH